MSARDVRVLLYDIETAPIIAATWGLWNQNIGINQIIEDPRIIGFGAKWLGGRKAKFWSEYHHDRDAMLHKLHDLFDEADIVAGWNNRGFDDPWVMGELRREKIGVPSPVKSVDLMKLSRKHLRWPSHKLAYVSRNLVNDTKLDTGGFQLWRDCLWATDESVKAKSWSKMRKYCIQDTELLEPLWRELAPFMPATIHMGALAGEGGEICPACGGGHLQWRGWRATASRRYRQFQCQSCGKWGRSTKSDNQGPRVETVGVS